MYIICNDFYDPDIENVYTVEYDEFSRIKDIESNAFVYDTEDRTIESIAVDNLYSLWVEKALEEHYNKLQTIDFDSFWLNIGMKVTGIVDYDMSVYLFNNKRDCSFYDLDLSDAANLGYSRMQWSKLPQFVLRSNRIALDKVRTGDLRLFDVGIASDYTIVDINKMSSTPYAYTAYDVIVDIFGSKEASRFVITGMGYYKSKLFMTQRNCKIDTVWYTINTYVDSVSHKVIYILSYMSKSQTMK